MSTEDASSSGGSNRRGGGQNRNRRRKRNPNSSNQGGGNRRGNSGNQRSSKSNSSGGGGGARSGGVEYSAMPRRKPKPSLWKRFLSIFGLGGSSTKSKGKGTPAPRAKGNVKFEDSAKSRKAAASKKREPKKKTAKKRTPERVEVTTPRLYVGNLSYDAVESDLQELFKGVGTVEQVEIIYNTRTQRSKGYAFINMLSVDEAKRAVDELHDKDYMGRMMVVSGAKDPREERQEPDAA